MPVKEYQWLKSIADLGRVFLDQRCVKWNTLHGMNNENNMASQQDLVKIRVSSPQCKVISPTFCVGSAKHESGTVKLMGKPGIIGSLSSDFSYDLTGKFSSSDKHGTQFEVFEQSLVVERTEDWTIKYLSCGEISGIGPTDARLIFKAFGLESVKTLEDNPDALLEVPGIDPERAAQIVSKIHESTGPAYLKNRLLAAGMTEQSAAKISKAMKAQNAKEAKEVLQNFKKDPFSVMSVAGIGFEEADSLWSHISGHASDELKDELQYQRACAVILETLSGRFLRGSTGMEKQDLARIAEKVYGVHLSFLARAFKDLRADGSLVSIKRDPSAAEEYIFTKSNYMLELEIAKRIKDKVFYDSTPFQLSSDESLRQLVESVELKSHTGAKIQMDEVQKQAVLLALKNPVSVITGGPGTGKTTILRAVVEIYRRHGYDLTVCAFTGKAAKRASQSFAGIEGVRANTIHKTLDFHQELGFRVNEDNPLDTDVLMCDESSMNSPFLTLNLLRAVRPESAVILVGDIDQLPSIDPGAVLRDLINSGVVPVARLSASQRSKGNILKAIYSVGDGRMFQHPPEGAADFFPIKIKKSDYPTMMSQAKEALARNIHRMITEFGVSRDDIQIYVPEINGDFGCEALNEFCQSLLNPDAPMLGFDMGKKIKVPARAGDRVMETENDTEKDVQNGEIGTLIDYDMVTGVLRVKFPDKPEPVTYDAYEKNRLDMAFAATVHKSQGSESKCVITAFLPTIDRNGRAVFGRSHLERSLAFTALSRAKDHLIVIYDEETMSKTIANVQSTKRVTVLSHALISDVSNPPRRKVDPTGGMTPLRMVG